MSVGHWASALCTNNTVCAEQLLPFWESGSFTHAGQSVPPCPASWESPGHSSVRSFLGRQPFPRAVPAHCWRDTHTLCEFSGGTVGSLSLVSSRLISLHLLTGFTLFPFAILNLSWSAAPFWVLGVFLVNPWIEKCLCRPLTRLHSSYLVPLYPTISTPL